MTPSILSLLEIRSLSKRIMYWNSLHVFGSACVKLGRHEHLYDITHILKITVECD
ncbi:MAG: hypothetical protein J0L82_15440 [Deltaproteobacteria bacterium]|nr:hypothetical protein [Deltaproteobacteria bacterium]